MIEITTEVERELPASDGICVLFTQHTTCGLTINENADPDVKTDMLGFLRRLIPQYEPNFKHFEHNSDAHIKSSLSVRPSPCRSKMEGYFLAGGRASIFVNLTDRASGMCS